MNKIEALEPHLVSKVWGGTRLASLKGIEDKSVLPLGETWEVSLLEEGACRISDGSILREKIEKSTIPYLVKFIDTTDYLSVQVHPGDEYAKRVENSFGKTECWIILEADEGAGIYLGLKKGVDKETLEKAIKEKEDLSKLLNFYPVERGDFFFVPAGSIHAIGKGVTLAEVQQSSGVTYRVWDWNRVGLDGLPRELHVEKALDVINFDPAANSEEHFRCQKNIFKNKQKTIIEHKDFCVEVFTLGEGESFSIEKGNEDRFRSLLVLDGLVRFQNMNMESYRAYLLSSKDDYSIQGEEASKNSVCLIIS